ncbi:30S ribosomal protein S17 [Pendulispora brunnea]|uniref:Small ribosomal subunit protein uS17 n=1 Tax=Pendulispora brunnea TaxID=2905690 RepID=A0ABZ2K4R6_9BACT
MATEKPASNAVPAPKHSTLAVERAAHGFRRKMTGFVIRDKMDKTVVVEVVISRRDPLYGKYIRQRERYKAHDEKNEFRNGDLVEIQEHRPISRDKRFKVVRLVKKFVEE